MSGWARDEIVGGKVDQEVQQNMAGHPCVARKLRENAKSFFMLGNSVFSS